MSHASSFVCVACDRSSLAWGNHLLVLSLGVPVLWGLRLNSDETTISCKSLCCGQGPEQRHNYASHIFGEETAQVILVVHSVPYSLLGKTGKQKQLLAEQPRVNSTTPRRLLPPIRDHPRQRLPTFRDDSIHHHPR
ncbi:hypothetical protein VTJ04DRAFT_5643 [Mycothermus thermophilus]|uniref:uncharacterized protein n=1 Tax=Humicola insolens TaxID=85995 RepID=UPI003743621F